MRLFRYCGSKSKMIDLFRQRPKNIKRIVEPFLGSGAYMLNSELNGVGYEANPRLVAMWHWLQQASSNDLVELSKIVEDAKQNNKLDVRDLHLPLGAETYVCVNVCGLVVGQLSSWKIYKRHVLPIKSTIECLPKLKDIEIIHGDAHKVLAMDGDLMFVDPPYTDAKANYANSQYNPKDTIDMISRNSCPIILTFGGNAKQVFPDYEWHLAKTIKVPNVRIGGTFERTEWVAYINW